MSSTCKGFELMDNMNLLNCTKDPLVASPDGGAKGEVVQGGNPRGFISRTKKVGEKMLTSHR